MNHRLRNFTLRRIRRKKPHIDPIPNALDIVLQGFYEIVSWKSHANFLKNCSLPFGRLLFSLSLSLLFKVMKSVPLPKSMPTMGLK